MTIRPAPVEVGAEEAQASPSRPAAVAAVAAVAAEASRKLEAEAAELRVSSLAPQARYLVITPSHRSPGRSCPPYDHTPATHPRSAPPCQLHELYLL